MTEPRYAHRPRRLGVVLGLYASALIVSGIHVGFAQTPPDADYFDVRADNSSVRNVDGETVLELSQNVVIIHGDVTLNADRGVSFTQRRVTQLFGNVRVRQQTLIMTGEEGEYRQTEDLAILRNNVHIVDEGWEVECDEARYSRRTGEAWLIGNVVGRDSVSVIRADRLLYVRATGRAEAFGSVEIANETEGLVVTGRHGTFYRNQGEGIIDREPRLVAGPDDPEPVTVVSDTMRIYPDSSRAAAYYQVKIIKGTTVTQCDSAMLYDDQQRVELYGNPLARQDNVAMKGDRMLAYYDEEEIHRIDILGAAMITESPRDTLVLARDSWMRGDTITLYLHENRVDSVRVIGHASSQYYPTTPNRVESNAIHGERMFFRFEGDVIDFVDVSGKAAGVYQYATLHAGETPDSLRAAGDTTLTYVPFPGKAERVEYWAERIRYFARSRDLVLDKSARVNYRDSELAGETITYHSTLQILDAKGSPVLTDAGQKLLGERMDYDMESRTGLVTQGSTRYEQGFYSGENLAKVGENELKVWNSWYTTCDLKVPHYHFAARTMKVYPDDKVFTGPIWLHIGQTPIFALPFMANSIRHGRRSGFLRPDFEFGVTSNRGRFIRDLGYYWATNDYTDFLFKFDFNEDREWLGHIDNRYALRYRFQGGVSFNYLRDLTDQSTEWTFDGSHNQNLGERSTLAANLRFVSSDDAPQNVNTIDDVDRYIDRSIRSTASLRKSWDTVGFSASGSRTQNLNIEDPDAIKLNMVLPDVQLSIPSRNLYFGSDAGAPEGLWQSLLKNTRYSPSLSGSRSVTEKLFERSDTRTARASLGFSSPQRIGFVTVSPALNTNFVSTHVDFDRQAYTDIGIVGGVPDTTFVSALDSSLTDNKFNWNVGASANTNFYGTFYPHVGRLRGIRHTITPSASYQYAPPRDGQPRQQSVGLVLRNALDLKVVKSDTSTAESDVRKLSGVVLWNLSSSYRPDAPRETAWSNVNSNVNFTLAGANISLNHIIDPYKFDFVNTSATASLRIGGSHPFGRSSTVEVRELNVAAAADTVGAAKKEKEDFATGGVEFLQTGDTVGRRGPGELELEEGRQPWNVVLGLSYSKSATGSTTSTLRVGWDLMLTENWRIDYSTIYDVEARELNGQSFSINRNLHCWEMSFTRQQLGDEWQYYFRIALKAHPELYGENGNRGLGGGLIGQF